jgi:hypothetical protein
MAVAEGSPARDPWATAAVWYVAHSRVGGKTQLNPVGPFLPHPSEPDSPSAPHGSWWSELIECELGAR